MCFLKGEEPMAFHLLWWPLSCELYSKRELMSQWGGCSSWSCFLSLSTGAAIGNHSTGVLYTDPFKHFTQFSDQILGLMSINMKSPPILTSIHLWTAGAHEGASPADPKLRDLHDTAQQEDVWEEPWCGSRTDSVAEARGLEPHQWLLQWTFESKAVWQKDILWDTTAST